MSKVKKIVKPRPGNDSLEAQNAVSILSVKIDTLNRQALISRISHFMLGQSRSSGDASSRGNENHLHQIATINPEFIMAAQKDPDFMETLNRSDLGVADGIGLQVAAKILGIEIGPRITGVDLTYELAKLASDNGYSIFLLGAAEGVAEKAAHKLKSIHANLRIAGTYAGTPTEPGIVERVNESGADILLVAFGAPKQDKFICSNKERLIAKVAMGVGGTFDYIAGIVPYAPKWIRKIGMEWLYRLIKQPHRINRIVTATVLFPLAVLKGKITPRTKNSSDDFRTAASIE